MPEQNHIGIQSYKNNEASLDIEQYRVAVLDTADGEGMKLPSGANSIEKVVGVTIAEIAAGVTGAVVFSGIAYVTAYGAISIGDQLVIGDASGRVTPKAAGDTAQGLAIIGDALNAATTQGDIIPCILKIHNAYSS
jgi:hypothetical protein